MRLYLSNLVLEVTRRCNMKCTHCLRGSAQKIDMHTQVIDAVAKNVENISTLTITGGEPSLNAAAIDHIRWSMYFHECSLSNFWLTTNARFYKPDFEKAITELYSVCYDRENCALTISGDEFHYARSNKAYEKYSELPFFSDERMCEIGYGRLVNEGNAQKNSIGIRNIRRKYHITDFEYFPDEDGLSVNDMIYINAKGDVLLDCDLSYATQRKQTIGNVLKEKLDDIIVRNIGRQKLEVA